MINKLYHCIKVNQLPLSRFLKLLEEIQNPAYTEKLIEEISNENINLKEKVRQNEIEIHYLKSINKETKIKHLIDTSSKINKIVGLDHIKNKNFVIFRFQ